MTVDKVREIVRAYAETFRASGLPARRMPTVSMFSSKSHLLYMCNEMLTWGDERKEKMMRWLGFIQGVLAVVDGTPIDALKETNKS